MAHTRGLSQGLALLTILKGMIGAGILSLPFVFSKVRLAMAVPGYLLVTVVCAFSVWRLIQCKALLTQKEGEERMLCDSDKEVASSSSSVSSSSLDDFGLGPLALVGFRTLGPSGAVLAGFGIIVSQLGFCVAYVQVVVETLHSHRLLGDWVSVLWLRLGVFFTLCVLCLVRRLDHIARLSGVALFIYGYLLWALIWWGSQELIHGSSPPTSQVWMPVGWSSAGLWFGTAIFAQEAIVISQYVYDDMQLKDPHDFLPVLTGSFAACGVLSAFVGGFGVLCYGDRIRDVFYLNFPAGSIDVNIAEVILCLVLLASFVLQLYPVVSFAEAMADRFRRALDSSSSSDMDPRGLTRIATGSASGLALRCLLVALTSLAAACIPNLSCITGYVGSFAMSIIGFFLPSLCHIKAHSCQLSLVDWTGDLILILAGCSAIIFGVLNTSCQ